MLSALIYYAIKYKRRDIRATKKPAEALAAGRELAPSQRAQLAERQRQDRALARLWQPRAAMPPHLAAKYGGRPPVE